VHKQVRELIEKAALIGWTCDGKQDGAGHFVLAHESGTTFPVPATPSDWRGEKNAIANLERLSGRKLPRVSHRKSHKAVERTGFDPSRARRETESWHDQHDGQIEKAHQVLDAARVRLSALKAEPCRNTIQNEGASLIRQIVRAEQILADFNQPFIPFDPTEMETP